MAQTVVRIAPTRQGRMVRVGLDTRTPHGWLAYALGLDGHAVRVFLPICGRLEMVEDR
jgi:hypothetical protein